MAFIIYELKCPIGAVEQGRFENVNGNGTLAYKSVSGQ